MLTLFALPASSAPFCIAMKKGLVLVLVISVTAIFSPPPPLAEPSAPGLPVLPPPPQAANVSDAAAVTATAAARRTPRRLGVWYFIDVPLARNAPPDVTTVSNSFLSHSQFRCQAR